MVLGITLKLPDDMREWCNGSHRGLEYSQRFGRGSTYNTHQKSSGRETVWVRIPLRADLQRTSLHVA